MSPWSPSRFVRSLLSLTALLVPALPAAAAVLSGRVVDPAGAPAAAAQVTLVEARRATATAADGGFRFAGVEPGRYHLAVTSARYRDTVAEVTVTADRPVEVTIELDLAIHLEEIVVSAGPSARGLAEVYQPTTALDRETLDRRRQASLGETLAQQPGVHGSFFGPAASRPVVRGLGGDRVRVLEGGIGTGDLSSVSPDHAVAVDPATAERIEVVRGPASLLYGGSAIGGVVNVIDNRVPDRLPDGGVVTGTFAAAGASAAEELEGAVRFDGAAGPLAWHLHGDSRRAGNYGSPQGTIANSGLDGKGATAGVSWVGAQGHAGVAYGGLDTSYGRPLGPEDGLAGDEPRVWIDLRQRRVDLRGEAVRDLGPLRGLRGRFGRSDYRHFEIENGEVATRFSNDSWELRLEAPQRPWRSLTGTVGIQASGRDFAARGEESLTPPTRTDGLGVFAYEEVGRESLKLQLGARYERQVVDPEGDLPRRSFAGVAASAGLVWLRADDYSLAVSLARAFKAPASEELFNHGPHDATGFFEVGDPRLEAESSLGLDLSLRKRSGRLTGELNLYTNRFADFIHPRFTGRRAGEEELPVLEYVQADADFWGYELHLDLELVHVEPHHLHLELSSDYVRASLREGGEPLPLTPPLRLSAGLRYQHERFSAGITVRRVGEQGRVAALETPTDGYTMVDAEAAVQLFSGAAAHDFTLRAGNLGDALARNHVSLLKAVAPLPGRDLRLGYRLRF